jgi:hypothetical protein
MKQLRRTTRPVVPTVKGKPAAGVQDAEAYYRLLDAAARVSSEEGIGQGLEDSRTGKTRPAREFFSEFESRHVLHIRHGARKSFRASDLS